MENLDDLRVIVDIYRLMLHSTISNSIKNITDHKNFMHACFKCS